MRNKSVLELGSLIRVARKKMGLSQLEVARLADVSRRTVQNVESGRPHVKSSSLKAIGAALNLAVRDDGTLSEKTSVTNLASFGYWPFRMFKFVSARLSAGEYAFCHDEGDFRRTLETLWANFQAGLADINPLIAARMLKNHPRFCSKQGYFDRYLGIWRAAPECFSFSTVGQQKTGVSIVLPVAEKTFEEFTTGRRSNFDINGDEILPASPTVIYESICPFPDWGTQSHSLNESLAFVATNHLSTVLPYVRAHPCRIASFGAHSANVKKMRSAGLRPVGSEIPGLEFPIWHISNQQNQELSEDEGIRSSTMYHFLSLRQKSANLRGRLCFEAIAALQANRLSNAASFKRVA